MTIFFSYSYYSTTVQIVNIYNTDVVDKMLNEFGLFHDICSVLGEQQY